MFVSIAVVGVLDAFGYPRGSTAPLVVVALGGAGTFAIMLVSLYRWSIGYSRSDFQEQAAAEHREHATARRGLLRRLFKRNDS
jgi:hypothetical protein